MAKKSLPQEEPITPEIESDPAPEAPVEVPEDVKAPEAPPESPEAAPEPELLDGLYRYLGPQRDYRIPGRGKGTLYTGSNYRNLPASSPEIRDAITNGHLTKL